MPSDREPLGPGEPFARAPPHGFGLHADDERLLRGPVPERALAWAAGAAGSGSRIRGSRALPGGTSSAVHRLSVEAANGRIRELVLRRFVRSDWLAAEPDLARREAAALELVAGAAVPTPRLVAVDVDGSEAGEPAVLMTELPGRVVWDPPAVEAFLRALAETLPAVHATPLTATGALPPYRPYGVLLRHAPRWAARPDVWLRAIDLLDNPVPGDERLLIHRDYHPGNVLWTGGNVSGLVDWVNASVGSPWADVGHCRVNLAGELGPDAADRFLELYRVTAGRDDAYHPYWDISAAIGGLDESYDQEPSPEDESFVASALARL
jgi:aminoglycoside phosphotransferase (APT) family kinase protein